MKILTVTKAVGLPPAIVAYLKPLTSCLLAVGVLSAANALPTGGQVVTGAASIDVKTAANLVVEQNSAKAAIDWQSFSIGEQEKVIFQQPNSAAIMLNRVVGNEKSLINGALQANGQVFLVNSHGVVFNKNAQVNTAGLVASTLDISNQDFIKNNFNFKGQSLASITNFAELDAQQSYIALLAPVVSNQGKLTAEKGRVALAAGEEINLTFAGKQLVQLQISQGFLNALVENKHAILADGGKVILSAKGVGELLSAQVNNTGVIKAQSIKDLQGSIEIRADLGSAQIAGSLDASAKAAGAQGGKITTAGEQVSVAADTNISTQAGAGQTGTWQLISGAVNIGDAAQLSSQQLARSLERNNVLIKTQQQQPSSSGVIRLSAPLSWHARTALSLDAATDIDLNAALTLQGNGSALNLNYAKRLNILTPASFSGIGYENAQLPQQYARVNFAGHNQKLNLNGQDYSIIRNMQELAAISGQPGYYALGADITAEQTYTSSVINSFSGTLNGLGHVIDKLTLINTDVDWFYIDDKQTYGSVKDYRLGLIGTATDDVEITNLGLTNLNIALSRILDRYTVLRRNGVIVFDDDYRNARYMYDVLNKADVGGLIANSEMAKTNLSHIYTSGKMTGGSSMGSLVGKGAPRITNSFSQVDFTGNDEVHFQNIGGLVGTGSGVIGADISHSHALGSIKGGIAVGGLAGNGSIRVKDSYYKGQIDNTGKLDAIRKFLTAEDSTMTNGPVGAGGIMGSGSLTANNVYAQGKILGYSHVGGLGGETSSTVENSHFSGTVAGFKVVGGLFGNLQGGLKTSYATGRVEFLRLRKDRLGVQFGGLAGSSGGNMQNSYSTAEVYAPFAIVVGGIAGSTDSGRAPSDNLIAYGRVTGWDEVGGLFGSAVNHVTNSQAFGDVVVADRKKYADWVADLKYPRDMKRYTVGGLFGTIYDYNTAVQIDGNAFYGNIYLAGGIPTDYSPTSIDIGGVAGGVWSHGTIKIDLAKRINNNSSAAIIFNGAKIFNAANFGKAAFNNKINRVNPSNTQIVAPPSAPVINIQPQLQKLQHTMSQSNTSIVKRGSNSKRQLADDSGELLAAGQPFSFKNHIDDKRRKNYSTNIRRVEVDGVVYELEDTDVELN